MLENSMGVVPQISVHSYVSAGHRAFLVELLLSQHCIVTKVSVGEL